MSRTSRVGSVEWNRQQWGKPEEWERGGNNWTFHADFCHQPYPEWKQSVVERFLDPYLNPDLDVVEIGPGQGRWSEYFVGRSRTLTLVDLNELCTAVCRDRFGQYPGVSCITNDGHSLPLADASTDLIWSFGTFVHFEPGSVDAYLQEFGRVLRPGGRVVIHHTGWPDWTLSLVPVTRHVGRAGRVLQHRIAQGIWRPGGDRVEMSARRFATLATRHGLHVDEQVRTWGPQDEFGLAFHDVISLGCKPGVPPK